MAIANSHCSMAGSNFLRITLRAAFCIGAAFSISGAGAQETTVREKIAAAIVIPDAGEQVDAILSLKKTPSPEIVGWLEKWKEGVIFIYEAPDGTIIPALRSGLGRRSAAKTPPMALSGASRREQIPAVKLLRAPACGIIGKND
jgi:hypothetical protein